MGKANKYINRELSWLSFNERVLQEAEDASVPLIERLRFLGIFSNNLDEFFRVRVATQKRMSLLPDKAKAEMLFHPDVTLKQIQKKVVELNKRFEKNYNHLIKQLSKQKIHFVSNNQIDEKQGLFVDEYFQEEVRPLLVPIMLNKAIEFPELKDNSVYFAVKLKAAEKLLYSIIELPTDLVSRFLILPQKGGDKFVMLLDDVVRYNLEQIYRNFEFDKIEAYTVKITRDAELDFDNDISKSWMDIIGKSLRKRKEGAPVRFIYDEKMPEDLLKVILKGIGLDDMDDAIAGGRYHNFKDFIGFPNVGTSGLRYKKLPELKHPRLEGAKSIFPVIKDADILLVYPYQTFNYIIDLLREAAIDPKVKNIKINLYRVASKSKVMNALSNAVKNGKQVTVVVELQARFDEANNLEWSNVLQDEGVKVIFGVPGLKVHSKLIHIERKEQGKLVAYSHIGTGNFHEGTAKIYGDCSLLTADPRITKEVSKMFSFFKSNYQRTTFRHLIVSPYNVRRKLNELIGNEIKFAKQGLKAEINIKLNNLVDELLIKKLYDASKAGVKINLVIRGICSLKPGVKGLSENIKVVSIVDRFLEHARILSFHNNGDSLYFITSADWMSRNLDSRIEVGTPIYDVNLKKILKKIIDFNLQDNVKGRIIDAAGENDYIKRGNKKEFQSQLKIWDYFNSKYIKKS